MCGKMNMENDSCCEMCGSKGNNQHYSWDYDNLSFLSVLCPDCHTKAQNFFENCMVIEVTGTNVAEVGKCVEK